MENLLNSVSDLENLIAQLNQRKTELIEEQQEQRKQLYNSIEDEFNSRWSQIEAQGETKFNQKMIKFKAIIALETAILESVKDFILPEMYENVESVLSKVRNTNNNLQLLGLYGKSCRDDVFLRQVMKLISAVYRYNQQMILHDRKDATCKSEIKYATLCPHCGEIAKQILNSMRITQVVSLP